MMYGQFNKIYVGKETIQLRPLSRPRESIQFWTKN